MTRVLVTGGAGFIGAHTAARLVAEGHEVVAIDPLRTYMELQDHDLENIRHRRERLLRGVEIVVGSTEDRALIRDTLRESGATHVVHLGALPLATRAMEDSEPAFESILRGTHNLLAAIRETGGVDKVVYVSSSMVYGDFVQDPQPETAPTSPKDVYGGMKLAGEVLVRVFGRTAKVPYAIVRPSAVYGPTDVNGRIVQKVVDAAVHGRPLRLVNPSQTTLDFSYVEDVADGLVRALFSPVDGETFNVTAGQGRTLAELFELVRARCPQLTAEISEVAEDFRPRRGALDVSKARELLGYRPRFPLEAGIGAYLDFVARTPTPAPVP